MCGSRWGEGTGDPDPPPGKLQNIGFLNKTGPDPLKSQRYKASIQCLAIDGPLIVVFESFLPSKKTNKIIIIKKNIVKVGPPLDPRMTNMHSEKKNTGDPLTSDVPLS